MTATFRDHSYASFVALFGDDDEIHLLPHGLYVGLVRGEAAATAFAGRTMTVLDWHVALDAQGEPREVVGETLTPISVDDQGRVNAGSWPAGRPNRLTSPPTQGAPHEHP